LLFLSLNVNNFLIKDIGPKIKKKIIPKIKGVITFDNRIPNLNHKIFGNFNNFDLVILITKKKIEKNKSKNFNSLYTIKKYTNINKKITANVIPKFFSDGTLILLILI
jgi:hypothetical protein